MPKVVTYSAPSGGSINVTYKQERRLRNARTWPKNERGEEYCQVSHGLHAGEPSFTDDDIAKLIACADPHGGGDHVCI
jgi:hypothetical protein